MLKTMTLCAALAAALLSPISASAADVSVPAADSPACNKYRLKPVRLMALCAVAGLRKYQEGATLPAAKADAQRSIDERMEIVRAIDAGLLPTAEQQVSAYQAMLDAEDKRDEQATQRNQATMSVLAARAGAAPVSLEPIGQAEPTPAAPANAPSYTCVRQYGLPGYVKCAAD